MPFSHTVYLFYLQVVWYQATVCKPWPPFFQKVVTKVSPRNTHSQSNMTIIWACHCCSKILVLNFIVDTIHPLCFFCLISLFWWIWLWLHTKTILYPSKQSLGGILWGLGGGGVILNHPVPQSICLSEDEKFPDSNFKTPVWFHLKTQTLFYYAHLHKI